MKRRFAGRSKSSNFVEVCIVRILDTIVDVYKETIGLSFKPSPLGDCVAIPFMVREPHHERYCPIAISSTYPFALSLSKGSERITTQSLVGEGKDEGAVHLAPSPQFSPVEGEEVERRPVDNYRVSRLVIPPLATKHLLRAENE